MYKAINTHIPQPEKDCGLPVLLTNETIQERKTKILDRMSEKDIDTLVIYDDVEHGNNFAYMTGFYTRFEEGILILKKNGESCMVLGNETLNKSGKARIENTPIHASVFSLPNQPQLSKEAFTDSLRKTGIEDAKHVGIVGWKLFTNNSDTDMFDIPYFVMKSIKL